MRDDSSEIMRRLDREGSFVVTRNGVPVGELTPLPRHRFVTGGAAVEMFRDALSVDVGRFRRDLDESGHRVSWLNTSGGRSGSVVIDLE